MPQFKRDLVLLFIAQIVTVHSAYFSYRQNADHSASSLSSSASSASPSSSSSSSAASLSSASSAVRYENEDAWQPLTQNNWIILQTGATSAPFAYKQLPHQYVRPRRQRHPVKYYAYKRNNNTGNYRVKMQTPPDTPDTDANIVEPYVLAISNVQRADQSSAQSTSLPFTTSSTATFGDSLLAASQSSSPSSSPSTTATKHRIARPYANTMSNVNVQNTSLSFTKSQSVMMSPKQQTPPPPSTSPVLAQAVVDTHVGSDIDELSTGALTEVLLPLRGALEKVKQFCDSVQNFISDNENNNSDDDDENDGTNGDDVAADNSYEMGGNDLNAIVEPGTTNVPRGRARDTTTASAIATGRKVKKIKKKFKKLLFPLLIAYKLKFLTLIPMMIGGLILLVGTTGLAGFFFALFTAVMSLKSSSGNKSIVVKKI